MNTIRVQTVWIQIRTTGTSHKPLELKKNRPIYTFIDFHPWVNVKMIHVYVQAICFLYD